VQEGDIAQHFLVVFAGTLREMHADTGGGQFDNAYDNGHASGFTGSGRRERFGKQLVIGDTVNTRSLLTSMPVSASTVVESEHAECLGLAKHHFLEVSSLAQHKELISLLEPVLEKFCKPIHIREGVMQQVLDLLTPLDLQQVKNWDIILTV
jgi:hypothetical protein